MAHVNYYQCDVCGQRTNRNDLRSLTVVVTRPKKYFKRHQLYEYNRDICTGCLQSVEKEIQKIFKPDTLIKPKTNVSTKVDM